MKLIRLLSISLLLLSFLTADVVWAKGARGKSSGYRYKGGKAIDGDTFRYGQKRYRVQQYNAPEIGKPGWKKSTRELQRKLDSGKYKWEPVAKDKYGRTVIKEMRK